MINMVRSDNMATRMQKYYDNTENISSRTERNQDLYKEIANSEIDKFKLTSNATVLSDAKNNIDIEKLMRTLKALNNGQNSENEIKNFAKNNLDSEQSQAFERIINDPDALNNLLASEAAKNIMKKFSKKTGG